MFKKAFHVKSNTNQRNTEKKKLLARFTNVSIESLPNKASWSTSKVVSAQNEDLKVHFCGDAPLFFEIDKDPNLYPTVYFLWLSPKSIPMLLVHAPVFDYISNGADLMLPGVFSHPDYEFPEFEANTPISIGIYLPKKEAVNPVAVGRTLLSSREMKANGMKGKGAANLHFLHDFLWDAGPKTLPLSINLDNVLTPTSLIGSIADCLADTLEVTEEDKKVEEDKEEEQETEKVESTVEENDEKLKKIFFWTLKENVTESTVPIDAGQFYAVYILKKIPSEQKIDLKKTSFKKFSTFLNKANEWSDIPLLKITSKKGIDTISEINLDHPSIKSAEPFDDAVSSEVKPSQGKPKVAECYSLTAAVMPLMGDVYSKGDVVHQNQIREFIVNYASSKGLLSQNGKEVELDDNLQTLVRHFLPDKYPLNEVVQKLTAQLTKTIMVTLPDGRKNIMRNKVPSIVFKTEKRSGNKIVTLLNNFTFFGIEAKALGQKIQTAMATGASINNDVPECDGPQLLVHGNHVNYIGELLQTEYQIPKKYIKGLELGVKQKKGKR